MSNGAAVPQARGPHTQGQAWETAATLCGRGRREIAEDLRTRTSTGTPGWRARAGASSGGSGSADVQLHVSERACLRVRVCVHALKCAHAVCRSMNMGTQVMCAPEHIH